MIDEANVFLVKTSFPNCGNIGDLSRANGHISTVFLQAETHDSVHLRTGFPVVETNVLTNRNILFILAENTFPTSGKVNCCSVYIIYITSNHLYYF